MSETVTRGFGRVEAPDDRHLQRFSLTAATMPSRPMPGFLGSRWYRKFSSPEMIGGYPYIMNRGIWGPIDGGHAYLAKPEGVVDNVSWWRKFDQRNLNGCVGWSVTRGLTITNREYYAAEPVYRKALEIDEFAGEADEGTTVRAGLEVARVYGMWNVRRGEVEANPDPADGILEYRWCRTMEELAAVLSPGDNGLIILNRGWFHILNSWGGFYPHLTRMELDVAQRVLFNENGDVGTVTDRPGVF